MSAISSSYSSQDWAAPHDAGRPYYRSLTSEKSYRNSDNGGCPAK